MISPLGQPLLSLFWLVQLVNIILIAFIVRLVLKFLWRTPAMPVVLMVLLILLIARVLGFLGFYTVTYLLDALFPMLFIAVIVIFHEEVRDLLGTMGRHLSARFFGGTKPESGLVDSLVEACALLRQRKLGGLMVLEGTESLENVISEMVPLDRLSPQPLLIAALFQKPGVLHDGALLVRDGEIVAARAILPLSRKTYMGRRVRGEAGPRSALGTRHRAALGITEVSDATAVVVSEETGNYSLAREGVLHEDISRGRLREMLLESGTGGGREGPA